MFTMQPRCYSRPTAAYSTLEAALAAGRAISRPFDVSTPSGAIVWAWEMRP